MSVFLFIIIGIVGGILGGMGMGGGTALIPLLCLICGVSQHTAQAVNLIAFIPMSIVSIIIHLKNKLIDKKGTLIIILSGLISCALGCIVSKNLKGEVLRKIFGGFLVVLSIIQGIITIKKWKS